MPILDFADGTTSQRYQAGPVTIVDATQIHGIDRARMSDHTLFMKNTDAHVGAMLDGKRHQPELYPRGRISMLPSGMEWSCYPSSPYDGTLIRLNASLFSEALEGAREVDFSFADVTDKNTTQIASSLCELARGDLSEKYPLLFESMAVALATETLKTLSPVVNARLQRKRNGLTKERRQRVLDFAEANIGNLFSLVDMAAVANLSPYHFSRSFKLSMGKSPAKYMLNQRIERAKRLLRAGEPIAAVAHECAFSSQAHLTTAFKLVVGTTPGEYRRLAIS